jgi:hypothetical protein
MQHLARFNCKKHMEQSPFLVVNSRTTVHEIPFILWNLKNCELFPSRRPLNPILPRKIQSISALTTFPRLILILPYRPCVIFHMGSCYRALQKIFCACLIPLFGATYHNDIILLPFVTVHVSSVTWWQLYGSLLYSFLFLLLCVSYVLIYLAFSLCRLTAQIGPRPPLCEVSSPHTQVETHTR